MAGPLPGAKLLPGTAETDAWSARLGRPFHEAVIETNCHNISLVFSDLSVDRVEPGYSPCHSGRPPAPVLATAAREASLVLGTRPGRDATDLGSTGTCCARHLTIPIAVIAPSEPTLTIRNGLRGVPAG